MNRVSQPTLPADNLLIRLLASSVERVESERSRAPQIDPEVESRSDDDSLLRGGPVLLGGVRILSLIGVGGMGRVYLGHHDTLDIEVAVKIMRTGGHADAERFVNEARLAARIQHDHIVRTLHAGSENERLYLVLEYVPGINLKQLLAQAGALPWRQAVALALQAARGLAAAHHAGIVHRDIKPSNLLITPQGTLKIVDLGLALDAFKPDESTHTTGVLGTPAYMAPEQARDSRKAGPRADVYALGVTLYHMLSGEMPFKRSSHTNMLLAHIQDPVPDIRRKVAGLPGPLVDLLERMLAKDPGKRPADGEAAAAELGRLIGLDPTGSSQGSAVVRQGLGTMQLVILGMAVLLLVTGGVVISRSAWLPRPPDGPSPAATLGSLPAGSAHAVAAAAGAPQAGEAWQTPRRAVFTLGDVLPPEAEAAVHAAVVQCGLPVIERRQLAALTAEQDLIAQNRVDAVTALRIGRLIGGHLALFATVVGNRIDIRAVVVETGELVSESLVSPDQVGGAATQALLAALVTMPARGLLFEDPQAGQCISLGSMHGVHLKDRFEVLAGTADAPGAVLGTIVVTAVRPDAASVRIDVQGVPAVALPALVRRLAP
jgi:hypothetical protein